MKNKPFPNILRRIFHNWRSFKATKRREIRRMLQVDNDLVKASAFLPQEAYRLTCQIREDLRELQRLTSVKEWGR